MIEYIEGANSIISLIPKVKEMFNKKNRTKIEMWGSWETFSNYNSEYHGDLQILELICEKPDDRFNYTSYKKKGMHFYLVGELGYWKLIKLYFKYYFYYLIHRNDLSIFGRFRLAYAKSKRWISKWQFRYEIDKYFKRKNSANRYIKNEFEKGNIDIVYLYLYKNKRNS